MPSASNIVILKDGVASLTFKPVKVGEMAIFQDTTAATVNGRPSITASHRLVKGSAPGKSRFVLKVPVEETVDGVTLVTRESTVIIDVLTSAESTALERSELRTLAHNLLDNAIVTSVVDDGETIFG